MVIIIKFTAKQIGNTPYKIIDLEEHFGGISYYLNDPQITLNTYNFELLLEYEKEILFTIRNNYKADIYKLNLDTFECENLGSLGVENVLEGDSLSLRAINMKKVVFEYRINDEESVNGVYSTLDKNIVYKFKTLSEYEYLYLTDRYYLVSKDAFYYDEYKEEWILDFEEDKLYLYDRVEDKRFEIFDGRLKDSYHTSSNHFIHNHNGEEYFLNFPFRRDIEDAEELLKGKYKNEVLNEPKEISFIKLDRFVEGIKIGKEIRFQTLYSWKKESAIKLYSYFNYTSKSLDFAVYDLKNKTIEVFKPIFSDDKMGVKLITSKSYRHLETAIDVTYVGKGVILAYKDNETEILSPIRKTIKHINREHIDYFSKDGLIINGWDEDEDGSNYRDYTIILDKEEREIARLEYYLLKLEHKNILIKT